METGIFPVYVMYKPEFFLVQGMEDRNFRNSGMFRKNSGFYSVNRKKSTFQSINSKNSWFCNLNWKMFSFHSLNWKNFQVYILEWEYEFTMNRFADLVIKLLLLLDQVSTRVSYVIPGYCFFFNFHYGKGSGNLEFWNNFFPYTGNFWNILFPKILINGKIIQKFSGKRFRKNVKEILNL